jgi:hypothetical protein
VRDHGKTSFVVERRIPHAQAAVLPVELAWDGGRTVLGPAGGWAAEVRAGAEVTVDPGGWVLARFETPAAGVVVH